MTSKAQKEASKRYDAENTKQYKIKLNKRTDEDIMNQIKRLSTFQGYVKELIRKDMERHADGDDSVLGNFLDENGGAKNVK